LSLTRYRQDELWGELAYVAYHFHWSLEALLDLEHADRVRFVKEIASLNKRALTEVR
jgi:hypothetical protein